MYHTWVKNTLQKIVKRQVFVLEILFLMSSLRVPYFALGSFSGAFFSVIFTVIFFTVILTVVAEMLLFLTSVAFFPKEIKTALTQVKAKAENTVTFRLLPKPAS